MRDAVIVEAVRSPVGKRNGSLSQVHPVDLSALVLQALAERSGVDPEIVDDVIWGCVGQVGEQTFDIARNAALAAGWPLSVPGTTVDRQCGSSQQSVHFAAAGLVSGQYDVVVAGGIESMSRVPMGSQVAGKDIFGPTVAARYPEGLVPQGISAELIADRWKFSRTQLDEFAAESHRRAAAGWAEGRFANEVAPVKAPAADGSLVQITQDETIRPSTTVEILAGLKPAFEADLWRQRFPQLDFKVTAGNSSPINDGASAVLITSSETAQRLGLRRRARLHSFAVVGDDPLFMLTGVIPATAKVLERAGLSLSDIDAFEVNEAFASVVLAWQAETGADLAKVNVNGGATAIGHRWAPAAAD